MISFPLKPFVCAVSVYFTGLSFVPFVFILQVLHSGVLLHCANNMIYICESHLSLKKSISPNPGI